MRLWNGPFDTLCILGVQSRQHCAFDCPRSGSYRLDSCESASQIKDLCKEFAVSSFNEETCTSVEFLKDEHYSVNLIDSLNLPHERHNIPESDSGSMYQFDAKFKFLCDSNEKIILCKKFKVYEPFNKYGFTLCKTLPHCFQLLEQENIKCEQI